MIPELARELVHGLNNDLSVAVAVLELLAIDPEVAPAHQAQVQRALLALHEASERIERFRRLTRPSQGRRAHRGAR